MMSRFYKTTIAVALSAGAAVAWAQGSGMSNSSGGSQPNSADTNQLGQLTVSASHAVHQKQVGTSYTGIPIEQVSLRRQVGYQDLNLSTPAGRAELDKRVEAVARQACHQLQTLYPDELWDTDNRSCVASAVRNAKQEVATITASAHTR
jgi:UrcA family protein